MILGYFYYRRREVAKEAAAKDKAAADVKPDLPARADTVLSRPDPHLGPRSLNANSEEKPPPMPHRAGSGDATELGAVRVYNGQSDTTINLDPSQNPRKKSGPPSARSNPFADGASIQTTSDRSQSTNVIPIALVPPGGHTLDNASQARSGTPPRPVRPQELTLRDNSPLDLDHVNVSDSEIDDPRRPYASSARSGVSAVSYLSTSSTATDLDELPTIMTPKQGVVRQVVGISQAQVVHVPSAAGTLDQSSINTPASPPPAKQRGTRASSGSRAARTSKATIGRSPLAQQAFTPADIPLTTRDPVSPSLTVGSRGNPFSDTASPLRDSFADSSRSTDTFGSRPTEYHTEGPFTPRPGATFADAHDSRPVSTVSTADGGSIRADIGTASRVILGMQSPSAYAGSPLSPGYYHSRATSMQTNSGRTVTSVDRDDDDESVRPHSILSAKTTSSRADSVLAAFPFVPPSPISALPPRSPGAVSPNNSPSSTGSMFARQQALKTPPGNTSPLSPTPTVDTQSPVPPSSSQHQLPPPVPRPNYGSEAMERAASTFSTSGLETYPFQFGGPPAITAETRLQHESRASLDTLALSRDLAAFPLEYDRASYANSQKSAK